MCRLCQRPTSVQQAHMRQLAHTVGMNTCGFMASHTAETLGHQRDPMTNLTLCLQSDGRGPKQGSQPSLPRLQQHRHKPKER